MMITPRVAGPRWLNHTVGGEDKNQLGISLAPGEAVAEVPSERSMGAVFQVVEMWVLHFEVCRERDV